MGEPVNPKPKLEILFYAGFRRRRRGAGFRRRRRRRGFPRRRRSCTGRRRGCFRRRRRGFPRRRRRFTRRRRGLRRRRRGCFRRRRRGLRRRWRHGCFTRRRRRSGFTRPRRQLLGAVAARLQAARLLDLEGGAAGERSWIWRTTAVLRLLDGGCHAATEMACGRMDPSTSYLFKVQLGSANTRSGGVGWYYYTKVVDSGTTNLKEFVEKVTRNYPSRYGEVVRVYYYCDAGKNHSELKTDQDVFEMFKKHVDCKIIRMCISYTAPNADPLAMPEWKTPGKSSVRATDLTETVVEEMQAGCVGELVTVPCTPALLAPSQAGPSESTQLTQSGQNDQPTSSVQRLEDGQHANIMEPEDTYLLNPAPENEHVGVDEEGIYSDEEGEPQPNTDIDDEYVPDSDCNLSSDSDVVSQMWLMTKMTHRWFGVPYIPTLLSLDWLLLHIQ
ncbi:hypothetical protein ACP4OV_003194 [Aristida adscensionis]